VGANAVRVACENARKKRVAMAEEKLGVEAGDIDPKDRMVVSKTTPDKKIPVRWVVRESSACSRSSLRVLFSYSADDGHKAWPFAVALNALLILSLPHKLKMQ